jgi:uncharacterized protein YdhG (YjbR/CyaY superfamily)
MQNTPIPQTIDEYIASFSPEIQERLSLMRDTIRRAAPDAEEKISYRMAAFTLKGMLVYFAGHTNHMGFYPFTTVLREFSEELKPYKTSKGGIQLPYRDPLPVELISRIIEFRVKENLLKAELKSAKKPAVRKTR